MIYKWYNNDLKVKLEPIFSEVFSVTKMTIMCQCLPCFI